MSGRPNFNRTRNDTMFPPPFPWERNRSNNSNFGFDRGNDTGPRDRDRDPFDESPEIMFYLLIPLVIPSIICFLFLFYNFLRLPHLRARPSNFLIICLLIINFIHVSHRSIILRISWTWCFFYLLVVASGSANSSAFSFWKWSSDQTTIVLSDLDMVWQYFNNSWSVHHGIYIDRTLSFDISSYLSSPS